MKPTSRRILSRPRSRAWLGLALLLLAAGCGDGEGPGGGGTVPGGDLDRLELRGSIRSRRFRDRAAAAPAEVRLDLTIADNLSRTGPIHLDRGMELTGPAPFCPSASLRIDLDISDRGSAILTIASTDPTCDALLRAIEAAGVVVNARDITTTRGQRVRIFSLTAT